jgi:hypothetical protein
MNCHLSTDPDGKAARSNRVTYGGEMTLRSDLTALFAEAGIVDVDVDVAVADEHVRSSAYRRVIAVAAASDNRDGDREIVAMIVRDPHGMGVKSAVVELIDSIAVKSADPAGFRRWAAGLLSETDRLTGANREFVRQRVHDWLCWMSIKDGHVPAPAELAGVTDWMQRHLADHSTSLPVLNLLAEWGRTRKIRGIARIRAVRPSSR